jgi:hypothetical protein
VRAGRKSFSARRGWRIAHIEDGEPLFQMLGKTHRLTGEAMSRRDYLRLVKNRARRQDCRRAFATMPSGALAPCSRRTAARWKRHRTWQITPIRARPSSTTGARIWPRLAKSSEGLRLNEAALGHATWRGERELQCLLLILLSDRSEVLNHLPDMLVGFDRAECRHAAELDSILDDPE